MKTLFTTITLLIFATLMVQFTDAAETKKKEDKVRSCWFGSAEGKDIMNTMRNTTKKDCTKEEKTCLKWQVMNGDKYFVGYDCGKEANKKAAKCVNETKKDFDSVAMRPCDAGDKKPTSPGCPAKMDNKNVTVTTCYCMGDYCNFSSNLNPLGIWIMLAVAIAVATNLKIFS